MLLTDKSIVSQIKYQVPWFFNQEYPLFIKFLEYYYQWMETLDQDNAYGVLAILDNYKKIKDIDTTFTELIPLFKSVYFRNFPETSVVQKRVFIKRVCDLYRSKGTSNSLDLLLTIILGEKPDLYYPKTFLAKSSDTLFESIFSIFCIPVSFTGVDFFSLIQTSITIGSLDVLVISVSRVNRCFQLIIDITDKIKQQIELEEFIFYQGIKIGTNLPQLNLLKIYSSKNNILFKKNQTFSITNDDSISPALVSIESLQKGKIDSYRLNNPGSGFKVGDRFVSYESGFDFEAVVSEVSRTGEIVSFIISKNNFLIEEVPKIISMSVVGIDSDITWFSSAHRNVKKVKILDSGIGVDSSKSISFYGVKGSLDFSCVTSFIGSTSKFKDDINLLGKTKILQDNFFFQNFSYVVSYTTPQSTFPESEIKNLIHPLGYLMFQRKDIEDTFLLSSAIEPVLDFSVNQYPWEKIISIYYNSEEEDNRQNTSLVKYTNDTPMNVVINNNSTNVDMVYCFETRATITQETYSLVTPDSIDLVIELLSNTLSVL